MKSGKCPKCGAEEVIHVPGLGLNLAGRSLMVGFWSTIIPVSNYVCGNCGFTERYIEARGSIDFIRRKFERVVRP